MKYGACHEKAHRYATADKGTGSKDNPFNKIKDSFFNVESDIASYQTW